MEPSRVEQQLPPRPNPAPAFGRCLKNQAASTGYYYSVDGCNKFTPTDPDSPQCEACGCHRNFHYCEGDQSQRVELIDCPYHHPPPPPPRVISMPNNNGTLDSPSAAPISSSYYSAAPPHMFFALSPSFPAPPPPPEPANNVNRPPTLNAGSNGGGRKKRFRTKFSEEQKAKMQEFAERIGWKMPKREEEIIVGFCSQIGVERGVFKVWMHNHKNSSLRDNNHRNHRDDGSNGKGANGSSSSS